jgi:hypothetical protein
METKSTFLSEKMWKTIPFSKFPKVPFQQMLDLLLEVPMILTRTDQLRALSVEEQLPVAIALLQDCLAIELKVRKVISQLETANEGPIYWSIPSDDKENETHASTSSYIFSSVRAGITMVLSWATLTVFWSGICHLYKRIGCLTTLTPLTDGTLLGQYTVDGQAQQFSLQSPDCFQQFPMMAKYVCRSVEFCIQDEMGMTIMACPLTMVLHGLITWPGLDSEIVLTKKMLARIQQKGMNIVQYTY